MTDFPNAVWDGATDTRDPAKAPYASPSPEDWARVSSELIAAQNELDSVSFIRDCINKESSAIVIGAPVYLYGAGEAKIANCNAAATAGIIGLSALPTVAADGSLLIRRNGILQATTTQWDAVTGQTGGLTPGARYYGDITAGKLTSTAITTATKFHAPVGWAKSTTEMVISIDAPRVNA